MLKTILEFFKGLTKSKIKIKGEVTVDTQQESKKDNILLDSVRD